VERAVALVEPVVERAVALVEPVVERAVAFVELTVAFERRLGRRSAPPLA
jgi:hypothetical protein